MRAGTGPPLPAFAGHKTSRNNVRDRILLPILSHRKIMAKILRSDDVSSRTIYPEKIEILFVRFPIYLYIYANKSCPQMFYLNYVLMKNLSIVIGSLTTDARDALAGGDRRSNIRFGCRRRRGWAEGRRRRIEQWRFGVNL